MESKRDFKGVWIDKHIWLNDELTWMEKLFIVEINSLDMESGCFASNAHFADFFQLSNGRVSQIIKSLIDKGYINAEYIKEGKQIVKRVLRILNTGIKNTKQPIKETKEEYLENDKGNNTENNNTSNNTIIAKTWKNDFETYQKEVRENFKKLTTDKNYLKERQTYHPNLNIVLTLEKACRDYWVTQAGWIHKKKQRISEIDWKRTFNNALTQKSNQVWNAKEQPKIEGTKGAAYESIN